MNTQKNGLRCRFRERLQRCLHGAPCDKRIAPLSQQGRCGRVRICKVIGDRALCGRIAALGVYPGAEADIICSDAGSQHILKVNGGTVSLDADLCANILVTTL